MSKLELILIILVLSPIVFAEIQPMGGGGLISINSFYGSADEKTKCLIDNCDNICKDREFTNGHYYAPNKCWCELDEQTTNGVVVSPNSGWIEIKECHNSTDPSLVANENFNQKTETTPEFWKIDWTSVAIGFVIGAVVIIIIAIIGSSLS